jgi:hypothetical protein
MQSSQCVPKCDLSLGLTWNQTNKACISQRFVSTSAQGPISIKLNSTYGLKSWGLQAMSLALDCIPQISRSLFNVDSPLITELEIRLDYSISGSAQVTPGRISLNPLLLSPSPFDPIFLVEIVTQAMRPIPIQFLTNTPANI